MVIRFIPRRKIESILVFLEIVLMVILIMLIAKDLDEVWKGVWRAILIFGFVYFGFLFIRIHLSEIKILSLYYKRDKEIITIEQESVPMGVIDRQIRIKELEYQGKISFIERRRKYDLEKIPLLRK